MKPVCGFVGLGSQGAPIARRMVVLGPDDPAYRPLRASANQFLSFVLGPAQETWEAQRGAGANS